MVHMAPHPTPCSIRPTYSTRVAVGNVIISQPKMTFDSPTISDTRRPNTADTAPAGTAPITAPTPNSEHTVAAAIGDTSKSTAEPFSSIFWVGDDHPSTVPMTNAPKDAASQKCNANDKLIVTQCACSININHNCNNIERDLVTLNYNIDLWLCKYDVVVILDIIYTYTSVVNVRFMLAQCNTTMYSSKRFQICDIDLGVPIAACGQLTSLFYTRGRMNSIIMPVYHTYVYRINGRYQSLCQV